MASVATDGPAPHDGTNGSAQHDANGAVATDGPAPHDGSNGSAQHDANGAVATDGPAPHDGSNGSAQHDANGAEGENGSAVANGDMVPPKFTLTEPLEARRPEIKFAPTVKRSDGIDDDLTKLPPRITDEEHIAILERQRRNQDDDEVLRIPGPRDAERGILPSMVMRGESDEDGQASSPVLMRRNRRLSDASVASLDLDPSARSPANGTRNRSNSNAQNDGSRDSADERRGRQRLAQAITIQEPEKPSRLDELNDSAHAAAHVVVALHPRRSHGLSSGDDESNLHQTTSARSKRRQKIDNFKRAFSRDKEEDPAPYLSWEPTLGRNSAFLGLSEEQREELGGIEYRSLKTLALVLLGYYWGFWLLGIVSLLPWILKSSTYGAIVDEASQNRVWWGFFTPHSAFMDLGFTLTPDSMNSFNTAIFPLLLMSFLIVIGNTGFPVMLRFVIWVSSILVPRGSGIYEELKFLLDHPRRCFTLLFPSGATWWLFWLLVILNGIDLLFFIVLDVSLPFFLVYFFLQSY
jgi:potassium uptake Trk family protein